MGNAEGHTVYNASGLTSIMAPWYNWSRYEHFPLGWAAHLHLRLCAAPCFFIKGENDGKR